MYRGRRYHSISFILLVLLLTSFIFISTLFFALRGLYSNALVNEFEDKQSVTLKHISSNIEQFAQNIRGLARNTMTDWYIINLVSEYDSDDTSYETNEFINDMHAALNGIAYSQLFVASADILIPEMGLSRYLLNSVYSIENYPDKILVDQLFTRKFPGWIATRRAMLPVDTGVSAVFSYVQPLYYDLFSTTCIGYLVLNINEMALSSIINEYDTIPDTSLLVVDERGVIITSNNKTIVGKYIQDTKYGEFYLTGSYPENFLVSEEFLATEGWSCFSISDYDSVIAPVRRLDRIFFLGLLVVFSIMLFILVMVMRKVSRPIRDMATNVRELNTAGEYLSVDFAPVNISELMVLQFQFKLLLNRINYLIKDIRQKEETKKKMEYDLLQEQINPHFIYNTLDTINWMALSKGQPIIGEAVRNLGNFLRLSLNKGKTSFTVQDELSLANSYMMIQKMRTRDKIQFTEVVEESIKQYSMVKIVLQPFLENSIIHGLKGGAGCITLTASEKEKSIEFLIQDNGCGINPELVRELNDIKSDAGHGIKNTMRRLHLYYEGRASVVIKSESGHGTLVIIDVPKDWKSEDI